MGGATIGAGGVMHPPLFLYNVIVFTVLIPHLQMCGAALAPGSPGLNPVDYKVWSVMQERVYQTAIHDV